MKKGEIQKSNEISPEIDQSTKYSWNSKWTPQALLKMFGCEVPHDYYNYRLKMSKSELRSQAYVDAENESC